jgi:hypothetical protein
VPYLQIRKDGEMKMYYIKLISFILFDLRHFRNTPKIVRQVV